MAARKIRRSEHVLIEYPRTNSARYFDLDIKRVCLDRFSFLFFWFILHLNCNCLLLGLAMNFLNYFRLRWIDFDGSSLLFHHLCNDFKESFCLTRFHVFFKGFS
jgi:hypothetical protein